MVDGPGPSASGAAVRPAVVVRAECRPRGGPVLFLAGVAGPVPAAPAPPDPAGACHAPPPPLRPGAPRRGAVQVRGLPPRALPRRLAGAGLGAAPGPRLGPAGGRPRRVGVARRRGV